MVSTRPLIASAASESPALMPLDKRLEARRVVPDNRRVTMPLRYCIDEPINLTIQFAKPQLEMSPFSIHFS
jgi:hypothetical protein